MVNCYILCEPNGSEITSTSETVMNIQIDNIFLHCAPEGTEFDSTVYDGILTRLTKLLHPNYVQADPTASWKGRTTQSATMYVPDEYVGTLFHHTYEIAINNFYPSLMISQGDNIYSHPIASILKTLLEYRAELKARLSSRNFLTDSYLILVSKKFINFTYGMFSNPTSKLAGTVPHKSIGDITTENANACIEKLKAELKSNNFSVLYADTDTLYVEDRVCDLPSEVRETQLSKVVSRCLEQYRTMSHKVTPYDYVMVLGKKNVLTINGALTYMHLKGTRYV